MYNKCFTYLRIHVQIEKLFNTFPTRYGILQDKRIQKHTYTVMLSIINLSNESTIMYCYYKPNKLMLQE